MRKNIMLKLGSTSRRYHRIIRILTPRLLSKDIKTMDYIAYLRSIVMYVFEAWTRTNANKIYFLICERKLLREF